MRHDGRPADRRRRAIGAGCGGVLEDVEYTVHDAGAVQLPGAAVAELDVRSAEAAPAQAVLRAPVHAVPAELPDVPQQEAVRPLHRELQQEVRHPSGVRYHRGERRARRRVLGGADLQEGRGARVDIPVPVAGGGDRGKRRAVHA